MKSSYLLPNLCSAAGLFLSGAVFAQASAPDTGPSVAVNCRPNYPMEAIRANAQGVTVLVFHVNGQGKPTGGEVLRKSGPSRAHGMLDRAALDALMLCPFKQRLDANGQPQAYDIEVPYTWRID